MGHIFTTAASATTQYPLLQRPIDISSIHHLLRIAAFNFHRGHCPLISFAEKDYSLNDERVCYATDQMEIVVIKWLVCNSFLEMQFLCSIAILPGRWCNTTTFTAANDRQVFTDIHSMWCADISRLADVMQGNCNVVTIKTYRDCLEPLDVLASRRENICRKRVIVPEKVDSKRDKWAITIILYLWIGSRDYCSTWPF